MMQSNGMPIKVTPYQHQVRGFEFAMDMFRNGGRGTAFLMDMGTGKSVTTIAVAGRLFLDGKVRRVLVVCPKSIVGVWEAEFGKFADFEYRLGVLEGGSAKSIKTLGSRSVT